MKVFVVLDSAHVAMHTRWVWTGHKPSFGFFSSSASQRGVFFTNSHVCLCHQGQQQAQTSSPEALDPCDEVTDTDDNEEEDLGVLDDQRSIMLHLLSQLKLGMDLTRVSARSLPSSF